MRTLSLSSVPLANRRIGTSQDSGHWPKKGSSSYTAAGKMVVEVNGLEPLPRWMGSPAGAPCHPQSKRSKREALRKLRAFVLVVLVSKGERSNCGLLAFME